MVAGAAALPSLVKSLVRTPAEEITPRRRNRVLSRPVLADVQLAGNLPECFLLEEPQNQRLAVLFRQAVEFLIEQRAQEQFLFRGHGLGDVHR